MYSDFEDGNKDYPELKDCDFTSMYPVLPQDIYNDVILSLPSFIVCTSKYFPFFRLVKRYRKSK